MKRSFLFSAIVALAVVLVGCNDNKPTGDGDYTSISFKESAITMICGDTTNLSLLYQQRLCLVLTQSGLRLIPHW